MENNVIDEAKIEEFIKLNDKRTGTELDKHRDLIVRLLETGISKKKIYEFIHENDNSIPNIKNFYKYIDRKILNKSNNKTSKTNSQKEIANKPTETPLKPTKTIKEANELPNVNKTATSKLSDDFDLLDGVEMGSLKK